MADLQGQGEAGPGEGGGLEVAVAKRGQGLKVAENDG